MDSFVLVKPTGESDHPEVGEWVERGERAGPSSTGGGSSGAMPGSRTTSMVTDADIASSNLILWGDPRSNAILRRIADKLPIRWEGGRIGAGSKSFDADHHVPILIYPNPLNPSKLRGPQQRFHLPRV